VFADDIDGDGRPDLWVTDSRFNRLMKNTGPAQFEDVTEHAGISQLAAQYVSWGTAAQDFDNDARDDIFIAHGGLIHLVPQEHSLFRNLGNGKFQDVSTSGGAFFKTKTVGRGACFGDFDSDGRIDLFLVNLGASGQLLRNTTGNPNHWIKIALTGVKSNRDGIGAVVEVAAGGLKQRAERVAGSGYLSQDDGRLHFGLGSAVRADRITVVWPSGIRQVLENVAADRVVTIAEK